MGFFMPYLFIKADTEIEVELPKPNYMKDWESAKAEKICDQYDHPKCTINLQIDDPNDSLSPILIHISDKDVLAGSLTVNKMSSKKYIFAINGTFKASIHKSGIPFIAAGIRPNLIGVTRFREGFSFDESRKVDWIFSTKKI
jgi:hypothetical protein